MKFGVIEMERSQMASLHRLFGMLRISRPYRERITADMRLQPSASAQILAMFGLLIFAKRYMKTAQKQGGISYD